MRKIIFVMTAVLLFLPLAIYAVPHSVYIQLQTASGIHPSSVSFDSWILGDEQFVLNQGSAGCTYYDSGAYEGVLQIQCGDFPYDWNDGDTLRVQVYSAIGNGWGNFILNHESYQGFGEIFNNGEGITLSEIEAPQIDFSAQPLSGNAPLQVQFTCDFDNAYKYFWDFNNDTVWDSFQQNPTYIFQFPGNYTVKLFVYTSVDWASYKVYENLITVYSDSSSTEQNTLPANNFALTNYPNPFNPTTTISFNLPEEENVTLSIYNTKGQKVKTLLNSYLAKGKHSIVWNGEDDYGKKVATGIYFYKISTGKKNYMKKMLLVK